jgi:hypothetical protein
MDRLSNFEKSIIKQHASNVANLVVNQRLGVMEDKLKKSSFDRIYEKIGYPDDYVRAGEIIELYNQEYTRAKEELEN